MVRPQQLAKEVAEHVIGENLSDVVQCGDDLQGKTEISDLILSRL
jgi:hypothetical protein